MPLSREVCVYKTSIIPPLFIEMSVPSQESELSCICVLGVSVLICILLEDTKWGDHKL